MMKHGEYDIIRRYFAPLAEKGEEGLGLKDDAALFTPPAGHTLVLTKDLLVEEIHFRKDDPPARIAQKLTRVNLSDLAAKGAKPLGYLMGLSVPKDGHCDEAWLAAFAGGLDIDQQIYNWALWGGDTVSTTGPLTLSLTAIGAVKTGHAITRTGAMPGDDVYVSGSLGDGALGLKVLQGDNKGIDQQTQDYLIDRYHLPQPRLGLGPALQGVVHAMMDVSDGLMGDIQHICVASGCGARLELEKLPISVAAGKYIETYKQYKDLVWCGGDDYELLFTAAPEDHEQIMGLAKKHDIAITQIGKMTSGKEVALIDALGQQIAKGGQGYRHF